MTEQARKDKLLVIDGNEDERSLLVEATFTPLGYAVQSATDGNSGLAKALDTRPDVVILDLHIPGLKGQDVITALNAADITVIAIANRGSEREILDIFRLGARDYVLRPVREAEIVQTVERAMKDVRLQREREGLIGEVRAAAENTERHLRELKTLMGIGKSVTAIGKQQEVFDRVLRAALQLTRAETAGLFIVDPQTGDLIMEAGHNLSRNLIEGMGKPITDDLASLVMNSHETYLGTGQGLDKFRPAQQNVASVIYAPLVFQDKPIGILWVSNSKLTFEPHMKDIMSALADYATIAVTNARLFKAMQERTEALQQMNEQLKEAQELDQPTRSVPAASAVPASAEQLGVIQEIRRPLTEILGNMNLWRTGEMGPLPMGHQAAVDVMHRQLTTLVQKIDDLSMQK